MGETSRINKIKINYPTNECGILDSGASGHFLTEGSPHERAVRQTKPLVINQPDGEKLVAQKKCELSIYPELDKETRQAYLFKDITFPLISVAKLCDGGCIVVFVKEKAYIIKNGRIIGEAPRDRITRLWTTDMTKPNESTKKHEKELAMNVTMSEETENNIEKLILFLYAALGRPNKSTLIKAIQNGHLAT